MSKTLISLKLLGENFYKVALEHANRIANNKGIDPENIAQELKNVHNEMEFRDVIHKHFGDELKIILT